MLQYYSQNGNQFSLKSVTLFNFLRIISLLILAIISLYYTTQKVSNKNFFNLITVFLLCISFASMYLLELSKKLIIDKDSEQIYVKENVFSKVELYDLKYFTQIVTSQSTTNFIPVSATASLIFYDNGLQNVLLKQKYFSTISSLEGIINETEMIINSKI